MKLTCEFLHFGSGTVDEGIKLMKAGELLLVSPGTHYKGWYDIIPRRVSPPDFSDPLLIAVILTYLHMPGT